jgi:hypothetical protein
VIAATVKIKPIHQASIGLRWRVVLLAITVFFANRGEHSSTSHSTSNRPLASLLQSLYDRNRSSDTDARTIRKECFLAGDGRVATSTPHGGALWRITSLYLDFAKLNHRACPEAREGLQNATGPSSLLATLIWINSRHRISSYGRAIIP